MSLPLPADALYATAETWTEMGIRRGLWCLA